MERPAVNPKGIGALYNEISINAYGAFTSTEKGDGNGLLGITIVKARSGPRKGRLYYPPCEF